MAGFAVDKGNRDLVSGSGAKGAGCDTNVPLHAPQNVSFIKDSPNGTPELLGSRADET